MQKIRAAGLLALFSFAAFGQPPAFEVAAFKPNQSGTTDTSSTSHNGKLFCTNFSLRDFITRAYQIQDYQLSGPNWLDSDRFDLAAEAATSVPASQIWPMLQALLAERFKLVLHRDSREMPVYALVVAKGGTKLHAVPDVADGPHGTTTHDGKMVAHQLSMARLVQALGRRMDRPVVDMTGLQGVFDFTMEWDPKADETRGLMESATGHTVFEALSQQLGLKLEPRKAPVEILVVDSAERAPTEN